MKKKKQLLFILSGLLILASAYLLAPLLKGEEESSGVQSPENRENHILTGLSRDEIHSLTIENGFGSYTLIPGDEGITLAEGDGRALDQQKASALIFGLSNLASFEKIADSSTDQEGFGLDSPSGVLLLTLRDGSRLRIICGAAAPSGSGYYARKEGDDSVYLLSSYMAGGFLSPLDLLLDRTLTRLDYQNLTRLTIDAATSDAGTIIDIVPYFPHEVFTSSLSSLLMIKPYKRPVAVNNQSYSESLEAFVQNFRILDFADEEEETGLDTPAATLFMEDSTGSTISVSFGNRSADGSAVYAAVSGLEPVVTLPAEAAAITEVRPIDMADRFVRLISIDHIGEIRVVYGDENWSGGIRRIDEENAEYSFQGAPVEEDAFKKMYQEVLYILFEGELPAPFPRGERADFSVSYLGDSLSPGRTTAEFYDYSQDYYAVSIDGFPPEFLVGKYQINALVDYLRAFEG